MTEISLHLGVPDNQISLHFGVPDNQISLHFGVPDNQISLHFEVPDNCSLKSSGGVRQSRSLANGSTTQTEDHYLTVHCTLYTVHCILYTVDFSTNTFPTQLFHTTFHSTFHTIFPRN